MSKRLISLDEFAAVVAAEDEDRFTRADLERFDYDAPRERCALISWCSAVVDGFGQDVEPHWRIVMAGAHHRWSALHDWGVLSFGEPPWRSSQVVSVVGRLGSLEAAVRALAAPGPGFVYDFDWKAPEAPFVRPADRRMSRAAAVEVLSKPLPDRGAQQRARWRRVRSREARQGELF